MTSTLLVTGAGGFIGYHAAVRFQERGHRVLALDNLSRLRHLRGDTDESFTANWDRLADLDGVERLQADVTDRPVLRDPAEEADAILHAAGQTAVTTSMSDPANDFDANTVGTLNVLEAARRSSREPTILFCSTNKVYGDGANRFEVTEEENRYRIDDPNYRDGIPEDLGVDRTRHTPYGCSKLAADLYVQEYARTYGLRTGVFRMSCIYGPHQLGLEDQGWVAWFTLAALLGEPITIYGDGKQVRDVLYVDDLMDLFEAFLEADTSGVWNVGGGPTRTVSLLELLSLLEDLLGVKPDRTFEDWRPGDQKVYVSRLDRVRRDLGWSPTTEIRPGLQKLVGWMEEHRDVLARLT